MKRKTRTSAEFAKAVPGAFKDGILKLLFSYPTDSQEFGVVLFALPWSLQVVAEPHNLFDYNRHYRYLEAAVEGFVAVPELFWGWLMFLSGLLLFLCVLFIDETDWLRILANAWLFGVFMTIGWAVYRVPHPPAACIWNFSLAFICGLTTLRQCLMRRGIGSSFREDGLLGTTMNEP